MDRIKFLVEQELQDEIDEDAAQLVASMAEDVLLSLISGAASVAEARGSHEIEIKDLEQVAEKEWNLKI